LEKKMKIITCQLALIVLCSAAAGAQQSPAEGKSDELVFREPFTLRLHVDKQRYYEERYDKRIPYVAKNDVYLFSGETFGINITVDGGGEIIAVTYQPETKKADVELKFKQEKMDGDKRMMLLVIRNKLKRRLYLDALMTVPERKGIYKTGILPVEAGLSNYESWPHPIVQLVLRNFRFSERPGSAQSPRSP
jgi:hypothetical protein